MAHQVFAIPSFDGAAVDMVLCNTAAESADAPGVVHYAYAVAAEDQAVERRTFPWSQVQDFNDAYAARHPDVVRRLEPGGAAYRPGERVLDSADGSTFDSDHHTIMRLGALELLGNITSGRLSPNARDPFPHQLALQQFARRTPRATGVRRFLIADEVGLGKTIEVGLILRDMLLALGRVDGFRCLYLTSGGLVDDAAAKLRDVLAGAIDGDRIVQTVDSFRNYGKGPTFGIHVASMQAARLYVGKKKGQLPVLPPEIAPQIVIIDECHHAASDGALAGVRNLTPSNATQTYIAARQLMAGTFWPAPVATPPALGVLMSATPFRSTNQFVNLLRLLADGTTRPDAEAGAPPFDAFAAGVSAGDLTGLLRQPDSPATVVWRRQEDPQVRSWSGNRIFPKLQIIKPHRPDPADHDTPRLASPSQGFLDLLSTIKSSVVTTARNHGQSFGGFAIAQLEKKLTSSAVAGACWLFSWAVRHSNWATAKAYREDESGATAGLRDLIRRISRSIAAFDARRASPFATVNFPSDHFTEEFTATRLSQEGKVDEIYRYAKHLREDTDEDDDGNWVAGPAEIELLVTLALRLLDRQPDEISEGDADGAKLVWLRAMLAKHPNERFLLFTESLQTCETLSAALGPVARMLVGSMGKAERSAAVADLFNPASRVRVLIATSAADEGLDLQVASKVIHWDLSPSPAVLMQRNGRVARLGQVNDVKAYYLILTGTHEERRDTALQEKFAVLGIDDEAMKSRILGSLSEEEQERLEQAIEANEANVVGDILRLAAADNERMDQSLTEIRRTLEFAQVLSRDDLADRLTAWTAIGFANVETGGVEVNLKDVAWWRPVFDDVTGTVPTTSRAVDVSTAKLKQPLVFDPDYLLFASKTGGPFEERHLAGLAPWAKAENFHGRPRVIPLKDSDLLGRLLQNLARLPVADFLAIPRTALPSEHDSLAKARWLLFCTHPLREAENVLPQLLRPYLTYYAFDDLSPGTASPQPLRPEGAEAAEVHHLLKAMEAFARGGGCDGLSDADRLRRATSAGTAAQAWLAQVTQFGATSFRQSVRKYFVPMPVALVEIVG